jgi:hypothetical protein
VHTGPDHPSLASEAAISQVLDIPSCQRSAPIPANTTDWRTIATVRGEVLCCRSTSAEQKIPFVVSLSNHERLTPSVRGEPVEP